jgi:hypothetical protein
VRACGEASTAVRPWAEVVPSTSGCALFGGEGVEKERQFVNWFPGLPARPNSNVEMQMSELWEILTGHRRGGVLVFLLIVQCATGKDNLVASRVTGLILINFNQQGCI